MSETLETVLRASVRTLGRGGRAVTLPDAPARQADGFADPSHQGRDQRERHWRPRVAHVFLAHDESRHHRVSGPTAPAEPYVAGYEPTDARLRRSPVIPLTSTDERWPFGLRLVHLPRLNLSPAGGMI